MKTIAKLQKILDIKVEIDLVETKKKKTKSKENFVAEKGTGYS
jgi:hypothetical protein